MMGLKESLKTPVVTFLVCLLIGLFFEFGTVPIVKLLTLMVMMYMIVAMSLNLVNGYTGQFSLGHAGFMAIGAYVAGFLSVNFPSFFGITPYISYGIYILIGGFFAAIAGFVVGLPSLRLRGDYLAIVTLGFGEIVRVVLLNLEIVGGARGYTDIPYFPSFNIFGLQLSRFFSLYFMILFWVLITFFVIWRLIKSSYGLAFLSVRDDEIAAEAMGVPTTRTKVWAFVISSFFAGVAGAIYAFNINYLNPASFSFILSVNAIIMVVLGGMGSMSGSILAAVIITLLPEVLRDLQTYTGVDLRMVIYSLFLVLLMIWRPQGLFGSEELPDLWKRWVAKFKEKYAK